MAAIGEPRGSEEWWEEVRALLILDGSAGAGRAKVRAAIEAFGSARRAARAGVGATTGGGPSKGRRLAERAERAIDAARRLDMDVITWNDELYPARLLHLHDPPPVLFALGQADLLRSECVTVVGSRRATETGRDTATRLGAALARRGVTVVSGLALGIDGAAHAGALDGGGETVAVLGTGTDVAYPRTHRRLYRMIRERGLLVSEFVPGTPALPYHFPRRNRILAALARHVVVVEAGEKSGSLITVDHALDLGREVWAVPGRLDQESAMGSSRLLADGARPLVSTDRFLAAVAPREADEESAPTYADPLLRELNRGPRSADELADALDCSVPEVMIRLTRLELDGTVRRLAGHRYGAAA